MKKFTSLTLVAASLSSFAYAQTTTRASIQSNGVQFDQDAIGSTISADGRWVGFTTKNGSPWFVQQSFLHDRQTGQTLLISVSVSGGTAGPADSLMPYPSANAAYAVFDSNASNLVAADTDGDMDVFLRDLQHGTTTCISVDPSGATPCGGIRGRISRDARWAVFGSISPAIVSGATNAKAQIYLRDLQAGISERVSLDSSGIEANDDCGIASVSDDGRYVEFLSQATNLVPNDTNGVTDVFVRDRLLGTTTRVNLTSSGQELTHFVFHAMLSGDGSRVVFDTDDPQVVAGDLNGTLDVFVRDLASGTNLLVSATPSGAAGNQPSELPIISANGRWVSFQSFATDLVPGDTNFVADVFLRDLASQTTERVSLNPDGSEITPIGNGLSGGAISDDARFATFDTTAHAVVGDSNGKVDVYVRDRIAPCPPFTSYCTPKENSLQCYASIGASGLPTLGGTDACFITATNVLNQKFGIFFWGSSPAAIAFGGGVLCVQPPIVRTPSQNSGAPFPGPTCHGAYSFHFDQSYMQSHALVAGQTIYGQFWSRDPGFAPPNNIGLTNAIQFTIAP